MKALSVVPWMVLLAVAVVGCAKPEQTVTGAAAARIAYIVSQHSPDLAADVKTRISQDFNGAPIDGKPGIHTVAARHVFCTSFGESRAGCILRFAKGKTVSFEGSDASDLYSALGQAGVPAKANGPHVSSRLMNALVCTVDDAIAQSIPASGDAVSGISCRYRASVYAKDRANPPPPPTR